MAKTVESVISEVRDLHPAFIKTRADEAVAVRALRRVVRDLCRDIVREREEALDWVETVAAISAADFTSGFSFTVAGAEPFSVISVEARHVGVDMYDEVERVAWDARRAPVRFPAVTVRKDRLFPLGDAPEWSGYSHWRVRYVERPDDLVLRGASNTTLSMLPEDAFDAVVRLVALELARPLVGNAEPQLDLGEFKEAAAIARQSFLDHLSLDANREPWRMKDVM